MATGSVEPVFDFGDLFGEEVHVFHSQNWELNSAHAAYFAGPQAATVDDVFGIDGAFFGYYIPGAVDFLHQVLGPTVAIDFCPGHLGRFSVGIGNAGGVYVAAHGVPEGAYEVFFVHDGQHFFGFRNRDDFGFHTQVLAAGVGHAEPVHAVFGVGQHHFAGEVEAAVHARNFFKFFV